MFHAIKTIFAEEGPKALWKGITAGLQRQIVFAGIRIGLYPNVRDAICGTLKEGQQPTLVQRILAGLLTGAIGISVASPTDVVKIRLQAEGKKPEGVPKKYNGSIDAYKKIVAEEG
jgi:solute carrier family 25 uncoupling protein 8/9